MVLNAWNFQRGQQLPGSLCCLTLLSWDIEQRRRMCADALTIGPRVPGPHPSFITGQPGRLGCNNAGCGAMGEGRAARSALWPLKATALSWNSSRFHFPSRKTDGVGVVISALENLARCFNQSQDAPGRTNPTWRVAQASSSLEAIGALSSLRLLQRQSTGYLGPQEQLECQGKACPERDHRLRLVCPFLRRGECKGVRTTPQFLLWDSSHKHGLSI